MRHQRVLVIQMCRIGDILMTTPLLRGLRNREGGADISLLVLDAFADVPLPSRLYDRLLPFPLEALGESLRDSAGTHELALARLREFVNDAFAAPFDLVVNLAHTELSGLVAALAPARARRGVVMTPRRKLAVDGDWTKYIRAASRSREFSCFHLADVFAWTAGVGRDHGGLEIAISSTAKDWASGWLASQGASDNLIALQLGASEVAKRWPVERFAALAERLPAEFDVLLVGSEAERPLAQHVAASTRRRLLDAVSRTSLPQLAALLQRVRLLVTNDTGPMHVAVAAATPVVDISAGPLSVHETGPYAETDLVVEPRTPCFPCPVGSVCHHHSCRFEVGPDEAAAVVRFALGLGDLPALRQARVLRGVRLSSGRLSFVPADGTPLTGRDALRLTAAEMWERTLDTPRPIGDDWPNRLRPVPAIAADENLARVCEEIAQEADAARAEVISLPRSAVPRQRVLADRVHRRLQRVLALGETERSCHAIVTFLRLELESIDFRDLAGLARAQATAYESAARRARFLAGRLSAAPA